MTIPSTMRFVAARSAGPPDVLALAAHMKAAILEAQNGRAIALLDKAPKALAQAPAPLKLPLDNLGVEHLDIADPLQLFEQRAEARHVVGRRAHGRRSRSAARRHRIGIGVPRRIHVRLAGGPSFH